jgi:hypothetical protein
MTMTIPALTTYDQYRRCTCSHIKAHHTAGEPWSCRMGCECESFMPRPLRGRSTG